MPLEFRHAHRVFRVDGDILEIFTTGASSHRIPLAWLWVQVAPFIKGHLVLKIKSTDDDAPLYEVVQKALGSVVLDVSIKVEDEPLYRQFFTQVAQMCGRRVAP